MNDPATNGDTMDFVTDQMERGLIALQTVKPHDYDAATRAVYGGISALDPRRTSDAELIYGRSLALRVWKNTMRGATA